MNKRILSIILVLSMLVGMFTIVPMTVSAEEKSFAGGDGSENTPYEIADAGDLAYLAELVNGNVDSGKYRTAHYKLIADITLKGENNHTPIGTWQNAFGGTFDGDGHTISGMHIKNSGDGSGFFAAIQGGAVIKNLALIDAHMESTDAGAIGALVGQTNRASEAEIYITNVYVEGTVKAANGSEVAGIIGNLSDSNSSYTAGKVFVDRVTFVGSVSGKNVVAGIVGNIRNVKIAITNCLVMADVTATNGKYAAGMMARSVTKSAVLTSYLSENYLQTVKYSIQLGGSVNATANDAIPRACISSNNSNRPALAEYCYSTILDNSKFASGSDAELDVNWGITTSPLYSDYTGDDKIDWEKWSVTDNKSNWKTVPNDVVRPAGIAEKFEIYPTVKLERGNGTQASPYLIGNATELGNVAKLVNSNSADGAYRTAYYKLDADITLTGENNHTPIGTWNYAFGGTFDGDGHTISGMHIKNSGDGSGFFAAIQGGATIKNLALVDAHVESTNAGAVGALVGQTDRGNSGNITVENIYVDADVVAPSGTEVGGVFGNVSSASGDYTPGNIYFKNVVFNGSVVAKNYSAGILGNARDAYVEFTNCMNLGRISSTGTHTAGIVTSSLVGDFLIKNCVSAGVVGSSANGFAFNSYAKDDTEEDSREVVGSIYVKGIAASGETNNATSADVAVVEDASKLIGAAATVPAGFTVRAGDVAVPTGCTVAPAAVYGLNTIRGASVRLAEPTGLRFTAVLGADYVEALVGDSTDYSYGIIIAPTDYVQTAGEFTIDALSALDVEGSKYKIAEAKGMLTDPTVDGCYMFTGTLAPVQEANYGRAFSAIAFVEVDGVYYYSDYEEELNSRSIAQVAELAHKDTSNEYDDVTYKYEIIDQAGVYSPYTENQRKKLADFFQ